MKGQKKHNEKKTKRCIYCKYYILEEDTLTSKCTIITNHQFVITDSYNFGNDCNSYTEDTQRIKDEEMKQLQLF